MLAKLFFEILICSWHEFQGAAIFMANTAYYTSLDEKIFPTWVAGAKKRHLGIDMSKNFISKQPNTTQIKTQEFLFIRIL